jgi:hypothetical protein
LIIPSRVKNGQPHEPSGHGSSIAWPMMINVGAGGGTPSRYVDDKKANIFPSFSST